MKNKLFALKLNALLVFVSILCLTKNTHALEQSKKLWVGMNSTYVLSQDKKWHALIFTQFRFINESHPWQATLLEGGIGYSIQPDKSVWLGYRWMGNNPNNNFYQTNRLFQQLIWDILHNNSHKIILRSRFEEVQRSQQDQIDLRFRQRASLTLKKYFFISSLFPFFYDEIFFQLNKTDYTAHQLVNENRLFIGVNFIVSKSAWWEIGYINQFQLPTPQQHQNQMSHILSIVYNYT